jgi:hypothetical protein
MISFTDEDDIGPIIDRAVRRAMSDTMHRRILPLARQKAPGSMGRHIRASNIRVVGNGEYEMSLKAPVRYRSVERGSGLFGPGGTTYIVVPVNQKALKTEDGRFLSKAEIAGQPAQEPMQRAIDESMDELNEAVLREILNGLT